MCVFVLSTLDCRYYAQYWARVCHQSEFPFQCWFLNFEEDDTFEPGVFEALGSSNESAIDCRDRHLRLKYQHLERALPEILAVYVSATYMLHDT